MITDSVFSPGDTQRTTIAAMETRTAPDYASIFSVLVDLVEIGVVVVNPAGEIEFASDKARDLLGCSDELRLEACHPEVIATFRELIGSVESGSVRSVRKEILVETDQAIRRVSFEVHPLDEEECTGYLVVAKDAENMRRMATDLRLAAQFRNTRRLYQALMEDLKQPISAVMLHVDLLRDIFLPDKNQDELPREARSFKIIRKQMGELDRALTLLLEEIDPSDTEEQGFSLRDVVKDVVRLVEPQASLQNVKIHVVDEGHSARLNGSRQRIKQAILNLSVNALEAMATGGHLTFDLSVVESADHARAVLRISDTGAGIDDAILPHIFEMHYTTKQTGTGVGLYVAREVIERHNGDLGLVSSEIGAGTTFHVTLPVNQSAP